MMPKPKIAPTFTTEGLGTRWLVELIGGEDDFPADLAAALSTAIKLFDDTYSRFKPTSLIGQLNNTTCLTHPPKELVEMFDFAKKMHIATEGAFDISVAGSLQRLGYGNASSAKSTYSGFWDEAVYSTSKISIPKGSAVDFGGFGKGWLLDQLGALLEQKGHRFYVINGGGDIVVSAKRPIELGLEHPYDLTKIIGTTQILHGSLAVSSVVKRRWVKDGQSYHHIIDPTTDRPVTNDIVSTYVKGPSALIADALSTIILLRPDLEAKLRTQFNVQTIILREDQLV